MSDNHAHAAPAAPQHAHSASGGMAANNRQAQAEATATNNTWKGNWKSFFFPVVGVIVLVVCFSIWRSYINGKEEAEAHKAAVAATSPAVPAAPIAPSAPVRSERDPIRIVATKDKWTMTVVPPPKTCMEWYGLDYITQVRTTADADWHTIDEWNVLKAKGIKILGVQHKALNKDTEVVHIFKDEDTCTP